MNPPAVESRRNVVRSLIDEDGDNWHALIAEEQRFLLGRVERAGRQRSGDIELELVDDPETAGSHREVTVLFRLPHTRPAQGDNETGFEVARRATQGR